MLNLPPPPPPPPLSSLVCLLVHPALSSLTALTSLCLLIVLSHIAVSFPPPSSSMSLFFCSVSSWFPPRSSLIAFVMSRVLSSFLTSSSTTFLSTVSPFFPASSSLFILFLLLLTSLYPQNSPCFLPPNFPLLFALLLFLFLSTHFIAPPLVLFPLLSSFLLHLSALFTLLLFSHLLLLSSLVDPLTVGPVSFFPFPLLCHQLSSLLPFHYFIFSVSPFLVQSFLFCFFPSIASSSLLPFSLLFSSCVILSWPLPPLLVVLYIAFSHLLLLAPLMSPDSLLCFSQSHLLCFLSFPLLLSSFPNLRSPLLHSPPFLIPASFLIYFIAFSPIPFGLSCTISLLIIHPHLVLSSLSVFFSHSYPPLWQCSQCAAGTSRHTKEQSSAEARKVVTNLSVDVLICGQMGKQKNELTPWISTKKRVPSRVKAARTSSGDTPNVSVCQIWLWSIHEPSPLSNKAIIY